MDARTLSEAMGGSLPLSRYEALTPAFNKAMRDANITTPLRAAHWCAQLGHESAGLRYMEEIASGAAYEGRRDLGNTVAGDGVRFKGRGPIQVTGRHNYTAVSAWAHGKGMVPTVRYFVDNPAQLASDRYGFIGPVWYWTVARSNLNTLADRDDTLGVTRAINGGTNGLADRQSRLARCKAMGNRILPSQAPTGGATQTPAMQPNHNHRGDPTYLADLLRYWGLEVREMDGWLNWGTGDFQDIRGVVCHHTAGANTSPEYIARNPNLRNQLSSQIHLARDGVVTLCGVGIAYHAGEFLNPPWARDYVTRPSVTGPKQFTTANATTIGIEAVNAGDGSQPWPEVQMKAYARICAALRWYHGWTSDRVVAHKEGAPGRKIDPNFDMGKFRARVAGELQKPPTGGTIGEDDMFTDNDRLMLAEVRNQLTGSHKTKEFPGWPQLGNRTLVDAVSLIGDQLFGPGKRAQDSEPKSRRGQWAFSGWPQLGRRTLVDSVGALLSALESVEGRLENVERRLNAADNNPEEGETRG